MSILKFKNPETGEWEKVGIPSQEITPEDIGAATVAQVQAAQNSADSAAQTAQNAQNSANSAAQAAATAQQAANEAASAVASKGPAPLSGASDPTTSTAGVVGQIYVNTTDTGVSGQALPCAARLCRTAWHPASRSWERPGQER